MRTLAVIVLSWNGVQLTRETLDTLARCRAPEGWRAHVIVVDNASTDGSPRAIAAEYPWVELIALPENRRFAGGNNVGIVHSLKMGAEAVMLLNNDVQADPGLYEQLLLALEQDPSAGAAAPLIYHAPPSDLIWYAGGVCDPATAHTAHRGLRTRDRGQYRAVEGTGYLTGCCLLATREAWEKVGMLDERYFIYAEDADWCLRARAAGYRLLFVPTARLWHQVSASSGGGSNPWKIYQRLRANWKMWSAHASGPARFTWFPAFLAQQCALVLWLGARGQWNAAAAVPRALLDAMAGTDPAKVRL
ncbi:MAG: glycosyltransferase family 2 protein [Candidatus Eisenbacteria bacterium]